MPTSGGSTLQTHDMASAAMVVAVSTRSLLTNCLVVAWRSKLTKALHESYFSGHDPIKLSRFVIVISKNFWIAVISPMKANLPQGIELYLLTTH